ncbi:hypothetical protein ACEPPN_000602 [Leptodophora sp. 'Broadleaf-Isolate-01']
MTREALDGVGAASSALSNPGGTDSMALRATVDGSKCKEASSHNASPSTLPRRFQSAADSLQASGSMSGRVACDDDTDGIGGGGIEGSVQVPFGRLEGIGGGGIERSLQVPFGRLDGTVGRLDGNGGGGIEGSPQVPFGRLDDDMDGGGIEEGSLQVPFPFGRLDGGTIPSNSSKFIE